jgi:putative ABC transport system permease protein
MPIIENFRLAIQSLRANMLRAGLTMLGIMIGVGAVISLLALGDGVNRFIADQFIELGTNLVFVMPGEFNFQADPTLTLHDAEVLADIAMVPDAAGVAPVFSRNANLQFGGETSQSQLRASTPDYASLRGYDVERGRFLSDNDYNGRSRVAVLGARTVKELLPDDVDPLEKDIKVNGLPFRIVGILEEQGGGSFGSADNIIIVPLTTAQERLFDARSELTGQYIVDVILIKAVNAEAVTDVAIDATLALRQTHNIKFRDEDDFMVLTQQDFLSSLGQVTGVLTLFLGAIASISLLVGGIGIMNIMLVSVTERTSEIGLRKAVGAKYRDILGQFLTEAVILSLFGGLAGVGLGFLIATIVHTALPELDTSLTAGSIMLAVGFSAAVGLFFGIYPASRAAALRPIDALRFE